ncbi:MAG: NAD(P)-dependent oxidoreductase [Syntrophus sp. (in: bacteria)]
MLIVAVFFARVYVGIVPDWRILLLPLFFLLMNRFMGVYTSMKTASIIKKTFILSLSLIFTCLLGLLLKLHSSIVLLWLLLTLGPIILARLFLGLPYSKRQNILIKTIKQRGPVLVVGGAGYIGTHLVDLLLKEGESVRVLDRLMYGWEPLSAFAGNKNFELIEGDATDIVKLTTAMKGASAVVHLSGLVGDPSCAVDPNFTRHTNIIATRMVKDVAQSLGIYRFIFASSCSVYGVSEKEVREGGELNPVSLYAQTKIDSEKELLFSVSDDFFVTVLRFATVFGHSYRPRFDLVANFFTAQAMNNGIITVTGANNWRPFIHVRDLAKAIMLTLKADPITIQSQIFNVGDRRLNMTILQLAEVVKSVVSKFRDVEIVVNDDVEDRRNYSVSFEKIHSILKFEAETQMMDGIMEIADNFRSGKYKSYSDPIYSNVKMTEEALAAFYDPSNIAHLYAPLSND